MFIITDNRSTFHHTIRIGARLQACRKDPKSERALAPADGHSDLSRRCSKHHAGIRTIYSSVFLAFALDDLPQGLKPGSIGAVGRHV